MFKKISSDSIKQEINFDILKSEQMYSKFEACLNAHGMYETLKFSVSLSPLVHNLIDELIDENNRMIENPTYEHFQAYSTYLHETIHWWQHVGSVSGLLLSLSYLGITYINHEDLKYIVKKFGAKKSLKTWTTKVLETEGSASQKKFAKANTVVNNTLDIEYYQLLALNPIVFVNNVSNDNFFESIGHTYYIAYSQLNKLLGAIIDNEFKILPYSKKWQLKFKDLSDKKFFGYFYGGTMAIPPIGLLDIYEGQAKFNQLQFLIKLYPEYDSIKYWEDNGHLFGVYLSAFNEFKRILNVSVIEKVSDPLVGFFLLICDIAINPTRGFPLDIENFENFITDVDVGIRFCRLTKALSEKKYLIYNLKNYSKTEYMYFCHELCEYSGYDHPILALSKILEWKGCSTKFQELIEEYESYDYNQANQPIRVMFTHFVAFCQDKINNPEFFCWPFQYLVGENVSSEINKIWLRHLSLFADHPIKKGVYPRLRKDRQRVNIQKTFNDFYGGTALYDLTRQWILTDGDFKFNYDWLSDSLLEKNIYEWASKSFKSAYGVGLEEFKDD